MILKNIIKYNLIGIGEFSHGIEESWNFRMELLKYVMRNTNKKITIFIELSVWQANNIIDETYYDRNNDKFIKYNKIKIENPVHENSGGSAWGKLWQYSMHSSESKIFLKIIKYIRKNKNRINIIGVDNETLARDYDMYKIIMENLNKNHINFFWAHNAHVDNRKLSWDNYKWTKDEFPQLKYYCGYYLKKKLGNKYCIILSNAYEGINRFNGYCKGDGCTVRTWVIKYFYKNFLHKPNKKYIDKNKKYQLLTKFNNEFIEFSNSFYCKNKENGGYQDIVKSNTWDYVLFWNKVSPLIPYYNY